MKKLLIALIVLVGFAGSATAQSKLGHVKSQLLFDTLPSGAVAAKKMQEFQKSLATELQDLQANLNKLYQEYQDEASKPDPSKVILEIKQGNIQKKETEFQERQQGMQYEVQAFQAELEGPILDRIRKAVEIVAKREKYDYIMDVNSALFVNPNNDVTDLVLVELMKLEKEATASSGSGTATNSTSPGQ